jgi:hypothetical protein
VPLSGCIFCGSRPLSGEHGLSSWFRTLARLDYPGRIESIRDGVVHEKQAPTFSQKFRVVCEPCNTNWMHDLEEGVKTELSEMVWGRKTLLLSRTHRLLATWLVKTCCVLEYSSLIPGENIPRAHYQQLYERKVRPPDWCQVWLAGANVPASQEEAQLAEWCCERIAIPANDITGDAQHWWFGTLRVGAVLLQVHGSRAGQPKLDRSHLANRIVQLWPITRHVISFPAGPAVTVQEMRPAAMGIHLRLERLR